ncbi:immunoglobulin-like domain-containing protein [Paenibacillus rhizoplanae]|uniref:Immunoglobulin-like domain-containing protein n=1 Tax=Paenibacillus rhizoplanae TaxID=1917181 RepID=A0ABW5F732_9BACL
MKRKKLLALLMVPTMILSMFPAPLAVHADSTDWGARAAYGGEGGTELFLGGKFIELGISNWGNFGTMGSKPANFRGTSSRPYLGMSADHDGYGTGKDLPVDYYLPGTPEERFAVGYQIGGNTYAKSNSAQMRSMDMPTTVVNTSQTDKGILSATTVSTWTDTMEIKQVISFGENQKFYRNDVTITNLTDKNWDGARYMRSMDPDNTVDQGGAYVTSNIVTHTIEEDRAAVVKASTIADNDPLYKAFNSRAPIFFYSSDPRAKASVFGFTNTNPYALEAYNSPKAKNVEVKADAGITMTWDSGTLAPNASKKFTYYTSLDERDFSEVISDIELDEGASTELVEAKANDGTVTGNQKVKIVGATLVAPIDPSHIRINNLPEGLNFAVTRLSDTELNFTLTGAAVDHGKDATTKNLSVTVDKENLLGISSGLTTKTFSVTFRDPATLSVNKGIVSEAVYGTGEITETLGVTLTGGKFAETVGAEDVLIHGLPAGLGTSVTRVSDTELTLQFTGAATVTSDVYGAYVTVASGKLAGSPADLSTNTFKFDFMDKEPYLVVKTPQLYESDLNDGTVGDVLVLELKNGSFDESVMDAIEAVNWPPGLTPGKINVDSPTQITVAIAGQATSHKSADSVDRAAVTLAGIPSGTFAILFRSPPAVIAASPDVIHDAGDGSAAETLTVTLRNGLFTEEVEGGVNVNNMPEGLSFSVVRVSSKVLEIHFSGQAAGKYEASAFASVTVDPSIIVDGVKPVTSNNVDLQLPGAGALVKRDMESLTWELIRKDNALQSSVLSGLDLPRKGAGGSTITWTSTNGTVVATDGTVTRPLFNTGDQPVTLTAVLKNGTFELTKTFELIVKKQAGTDKQSVTEDTYLLTWNTIREENVKQESVTSAVYLPKNGTNGSTITWTSSDEEVIATDGTVTPPSYEKGDQTVTLTAVIRKGDSVLTKEFVLTVIKRPMTDEESVNETLAKLNWDMIRADNEKQEQVLTDLDLITESTSGSTITWTSSQESVITPDGGMKRPAYADGDQKVTLTATVTKGSVTYLKEFVVTVKAKRESIDDQLDEAMKLLRIGYKGQDSAKSVTQDVELISKGYYDSEVVWTSHRSDIVSSTGEVQRPLKDTVVRLTARVAKEGFFREQDFYITVKGTSTVDLPQDEVNIKIGYAPGDSEESVTRSLFLPKTGDTGSVLTWTSNKPDILTNTGRVKRPGPDEEDVTVELTVQLADPEHPGETIVKKFTLLIKKLSDQEAAEEAARTTGIHPAATFAEGDTWESVTEAFVLLQTGKYDTKITWTSSLPSVIAVQQDADEAKGNVTPPAQDTNVILTATFTRNGKSAVKQYLLIVKAKGVVKEGAVREATSRQAGLSTLNDGKPLEQGVMILRTNLSDGTKIDTIVIDENEVYNLVEGVNPDDPDAANRSVTITHVDDMAARADEIAVEIPSTAVSILAGRKASLDIVTALGSIHLDAASLAQLDATTTDLYFRIVPVKNAQAKENVQSNAILNGTSKLGLASDKTLQNLGSPREIETNYDKINTRIQLPLSEFADQIPLQSSGVRDAFLDSLRVYVEHSDGEITFYTPEVVYNRGGEPVALEIQINKFSTFQIVRITDKAAEPVKETEPAPTTAPATVPGVKGEIVPWASVELTADQVKELQNKRGEIVVESGQGKVRLDAAAIDLTEVSKQFGLANMKTEDIVFYVELAASAPGNLEAFKLAAAKQKVQPGNTLVNFSIKAKYQGQTVQVTSHGWAKYELQVPADMKITTGVLYRDGRIYHQPTYVTVKDGRYYARINSLESGEFGLIWNPLEFPDVVKHWSKPDVNDMGSRLVASGTKEAVFEPQRAITRAEFTAMLARALGIVTHGEQPVTFSDVSADGWYGLELQVAIKNGLITGYPDGTFRPGNNISRQEAMAIVSRALSITELKSSRSEEQTQQLLKSFADSASVAKWAIANVKQNLASGIILGRDEQRLAPNENITRAEASAAIRRLLIQSNLINP